MSARNVASRFAALVLAAGCITHPIGADRDPDFGAADGGDTGPGAHPNPESGADTGAPPATGTAAPPPVSFGDDAPPSPESDAPPPAEGDATRPPEPAKPDCGLRPFVVHRPESATRVGSALYVALHDGRVLKAPMAESVLGWPVDVPELAGVEGDTGLAAFREIQPGLLARVVRRGEAAVVGLLTLGPDALATLASEVTIHEANPGDGAFAIADGRVHLCAADGVVQIDASDPSAPVVLHGPGDICAPGDGMTGGGRYLGRIRHGRGALVPAYALAEVSAASAHTLLDHCFNPGGAHHYGDIVALHLGGTRGIVDVQHPSNFFGLDLEGASGGHIFLRDLMAYDLGSPSRPRLHPHIFRHTWDDALAAERNEVPRVLYADETVVVTRGMDGLLGVHDFQRGDRRPLAYDPCQVETALP